MKVVLATANQHKVAEIQAIVGARLELVARPTAVPDVVEDGDTLEDNARLKAVALVEATGLSALADDTGLEVDALDGAPGVTTARFAGEHATYADNVALLIDRLAGVPAGLRTATFRTVALLRQPDGREVVAEGRVLGAITTVPRGNRGFGYDPVFAPTEADGRTFAEMTLTEKNIISHRARAFEELLRLLVK